MRIYVTSVFVDDQAKALEFYTNVLGFRKKQDIPLGGASWLTVVSSEQPDGTELLLEPSSHRAVKPYQEALVEDGIPATSFAVDDVQAESTCSPTGRVRSAASTHWVGSWTSRWAACSRTCSSLRRPMDTRRDDMAQSAK